MDDQNRNTQRTVDDAIERHNTLLELDAAMRKENRKHSVERYERDLYDRVAFHYFTRLVPSHGETPQQHADAAYRFAEAFMKRRGKDPDSRIDWTVSGEGAESEEGDHAE